MNENFKSRGKLHVEVRDEFGNLKQEQFVPNTLTVWMDQEVAYLVANGSAVKIGYMAIGSGTGQTSASSGLAHGLDINGLSGTTIPLQGTGANDNDVIFTGYWGAGDGTGSITEAGIFKGNSFTAGSMMAYNDTINVQKGASDTLKIDWTVTYGAS